MRKLNMNKISETLKAIVEHKLMIGFYLTLFLTFSGCIAESKDDGKESTSFIFHEIAQIITLEGKELNLSSQLYEPFTIKVTLPNFFVRDLKSPNGILRVFDLEELNEKSNLLAFGNDPYSVYGIDRVFYTNSEKKELKAFNFQVQKLVFLNLDSLKNLGKKHEYT